MGIEEKTVSSLVEFQSELQKLTVEDGLNEFIFRGHTNATWRLTTTFNRFSPKPLPEHRGFELNAMLKAFANGLATLGEREFLSMSLREQLEYARHLGVPSPLIDFTRSPLIATWFAYNRVWQQPKEIESVAIYALNVPILSEIFSNWVNEVMDRYQFRDRYGELPADWFRWERGEFFEKDRYWMDIIKFIPTASSWNERAQRQRACFLYDTIHYDDVGRSDLEDFLNHHPSVSSILSGFKFIIPRNEARVAMKMLHQNGINGVQLMNDIDGAVADAEDRLRHGIMQLPWDIEKAFKRP